MQTQEIPLQNNVVLALDVEEAFDSDIELALEDFTTIWEWLDKQPECDGWPVFS